MFPWKWTFGQRGDPTSGKGCQIFDFRVVVFWVSRAVLYRFEATMLFPGVWGGWVVLFWCRLWRVVHPLLLCASIYSSRERACWQKNAVASCRPFRDRTWLPRSSRSLDVFLFGHDRSDKANVRGIFLGLGLPCQSNKLGRFDRVRMLLFQDEHWTDNVCPAGNVVFLLSGFGTFSSTCHWWPYPIQDLPHRPSFYCQKDQTLSSWEFPF